jgi:hypothetical protein
MAAGGVEIIDRTVAMDSDSQSIELEHLAVDIARRSVLAHYPHASRNPIRTMQVQVRPEGDVVHTYARLAWSKDHGEPDKFYESEVFASLVYTRGIRRIYDISYKDNRLIPWRICNRRIDLVSKLNEDYERRDPLRMPAALVGHRLDVLAPRSYWWRYHPLQGDHAWHAISADAHIKRSWRPYEPPAPVYPRDASACPDDFTFPAQTENEWIIESPPITD